ncbi:MAG: hypothetical protein R2754_16880 [Microthrixaceae bacterium]
MANTTGDDSTDDRANEPDGDGEATAEMEAPDARRAFRGAEGDAERGDEPAAPPKSGSGADSDGGGSW